MASFLSIILSREYSLPERTTKPCAIPGSEKEEGRVGRGEVTASTSSRPLTAKQRRAKQRLEKVLELGEETVTTDPALAEATTTKQLRHFSRIVNSYVEVASRERTGTRHRFMGQEIRDVAGPSRNQLTSKQTKIEKELRSKKGHVFTYQGDMNQWRLRDDVTAGSNICERGFSFDAASGDFLIFYYNFSKHGDTDPGNGHDIEFSFWSSAQTKITWAMDDDDDDE